MYPKKTMVVEMRKLEIHFKIQFKITYLMQRFCFYAPLLQEQTVCASFEIPAAKYLQPRYIFPPNLIAEYHHNLLSHKYGFQVQESLEKRKNFTGVNMI